MLPDLKTLGWVTAIGIAALSYNLLVENPTIEEAATEVAIAQSQQACLETTATAAEAARRDAEDFYRRVGQDALDEYRTAAQARESLHRQVQGNLEEDIREYEQKLEAAGRSCRLDRGDFEWLRN